MAKILVVDDDQFILTLVESTLNSAGHGVITATNGHIALDKLALDYFDLVISDANMPLGLSGFDLAANIRKQDQFRDTAVMLLTGRSEKHDVARAMKLGVDGYVLKPVSPELLLQKVNEVLEKKTIRVTKSETALTFPASLALSGKVTSISEQGLMLFSPVALPANFKFRLDSETFQNAGIQSPQLKVISCAPVNNSSSYRITTKFEAVSESDFQLLRAWLDANAHLKKKAS